MENPQPLQNFYRSAESVDGLEAVCKKCSKSYEGRRAAVVAAMPKGELEAMDKRDAEETRVEVGSGYKVCRNPECKQQNPQPLGNFFKAPSNRDGHNTLCKSCKNDEVREKREEERKLAGAPVRGARRVVEQVVDERRVSGLLRRPLQKKRREASAWTGRRRCIFPVKYRRRASTSTCGQGRRK
jgi:hypothetical protein